MQDDPNWHCTAMDNMQHACIHENLSIIMIPLNTPCMTLSLQAGLIALPGAKWAWSWVINRSSKSL